MSNTGITDNLIIISTVGFSKNQLLNFTAIIAWKNSTKAAPAENIIPCFRLLEKLISITVMFSIPIGNEPMKLAINPMKNILMIVISIVFDLIFQYRNDLKESGFTLLFLNAPCQLFY